MAGPDWARVQQHQSPKSEGASDSIPDSVNWKDGMAVFCPGRGFIASVLFPVLFSLFSVP
jgi:hypothetical protein